MISPRAIGRLVRSDWTKLSRYWVVVACYVSIAFVAFVGGLLFHWIERAVQVSSSSGYAFAFSLVIRTADVAAPILLVTICIVFSIDVANATVKYLLTRPVTRMEFLISKYVTAGGMVVLMLLIVWGAGLSLGALYYGLGPLMENEYLLFEASYVFRQILVAATLQAFALMTVASMAVCVSSYSSTMGGAVIIGLILYFLFQSGAIVPASLGFTLPLGAEGLRIPYSSLAFPAQLFVPLYELDALPTGIPIETWWTPEIQRMALVCGSYFLFFFGVAALGVRRRDFTL